MFRHERPQKGRRRQVLDRAGGGALWLFAHADVEVIALAHHFIGSLSWITSSRSKLNIRPGDLESFEFYRLYLL